MHLLLFYTAFNKKTNHIVKLCSNDACVIPNSVCLVYDRGDWGKSGHGVSWSNLCTAYTVG